MKHKRRAGVFAFLVLFFLLFASTVPAQILPVWKVKQLTVRQSTNYDDGSGDSPTMTFTDGTNETAVFSKTDAGYLGLTTTADDGLNIRTGNLKVGDGTPDTTQDGEDAYVEGVLEVDGIADLDGSVDADVTTCNITSTASDLTAIVLKTSDAAGGIDIDSGTSGIDIDLDDTGPLMVDGDLVCIGNAGADGDSADGDNDLLVADVLEVDGTARLDGGVDCNGILDVDAADGSYYAGNFVNSATGGGLFVNSTGTGNVVAFQDGGSGLFTIPDGGGIDINTSIDLDAADGTNYALNLLNSATGGLIFGNNTGTGNTLVLQDGGVAVATIADGGVLNLDTALDLDAADGTNYAADIVNSATGGGLYVNSTGTGNVASFADGGGALLTIPDGGVVDLNTALDLDTTDNTNYAANIVNNGTGGGLFINNASTGNTLLIQDGGSAVVTIADGGSVAVAQRITTTDGVSSGTAKVVGGRAHAQVAASDAVTNTTEETYFSDTYTIPADTLKAGTVVKIRTQGIATSTNGADTLTIKLYIGGTALVTTGSIDVDDNDVWFAESTVVCRTTGGSGTFVAMSEYQDPDATGTQPKWTNTPSTAIDTTSTQVIRASAEWSAVSASDSCRQDILVVEIL